MTEAMSEEDLWDDVSEDMKRMADITEDSSMSDTKCTAAACEVCDTPWHKKPSESRHWVI